MSTDEVTKPVNIFADVLEFRKQYNIPSLKFPQEFRSYETPKSVHLIIEEANELKNANTLEETLDACIDLMYVTVQKFYDLGMSEFFEEAWRKVHAANMNKLWTLEEVDELRDSENFDPENYTIEGKPNELFVVKKFGKVIKPGSFKAPDHSDMFTL